jgi:hypothetical protein
MGTKDNSASASPQAEQEMLLQPLLRPRSSWPTLTRSNSVTTCFRELIHLSLNVKEPLVLKHMSATSIP